MSSTGTFTVDRKVLVAKLAAMGNRLARYNRRADEAMPLTVGRVAHYITECAKEFDLSNDEQMLMLRYIACERLTYTELLELNGEQ